jgi:hypothetical protein
MPDEKLQVATLANAGRRRELECLLCHAERHGGAVRLGSIRMAAIVDNPERQQAFMDMMLTLGLDTNALAIPKTECPPPASPAP